MLTAGTAAVTPRHLWSAWNLDPLVLGGLLAVAWIYRQGGVGASEPWRRWAFTGGLVAVAVALVSPLDALSGALASAHMVQHVLLIAVAAPLLALSSPSHRLLRGTPLSVRRASGRWRRRLGLTPPRTRLLRHPAAAWALPVATLWIWHGRVPYDRALHSPFLHMLEHATFLGTALLFWTVIVDEARARDGGSGLGILLLFAMGMQSVFLSVLLTFANEPWYGAYLDTAAAFGLSPLADQQLAGVIMWIPAGAVYIIAALWLLVRWIRADDASHDPEPQPSGVGGSPELHGRAAPRRSGG